MHVITAVPSAEKASASRIPIRSPKRLITATWTEPAMPARSESTTAADDTERSYTLTPPRRGGGDGSRDRAVRAGGRSGALRAARRALPKGARRDDVPPRRDLRGADGRAALPLLRRVGVPRP